MTALRTDTVDASSLLLAISTLERKHNLDGCLVAELREVRLNRLMSSRIVGGFGDGKQGHVPRFQRPL